mgnify:CR=1 FL=1
MALTKVRGAGAEGLTLSSTALTIANGLTLTDGNVTLASGHGVDFAATSDSNATMSNELLDDYEEGTWTPQFSSSGYTYGYANQVGFYTKVGRSVHIQGRLDTNSVSGSGTSSVGIIGLPYPTASSFEAGMTPMQAQWGSATARVMLYIGPSRSYLTLYDNTISTNYASLKGNELGSNDGVIFTFSYVTD